MKKAIFFDRDGTLTKDKKGYTFKVEDFSLYNGVIKGLNLLKEEFIFFIVSNQSGIGRGIFDEEDLFNYNNRLISELGKHEIKIEELYYCPHLPIQSCDCRKPKSKFINDAVKKYNLDIENSYVIGDKVSDIEMAENANCHSVLMMTGHGSDEFAGLKNFKPDYVAYSMEYAAYFILSKHNNKIKSFSYLGILQKEIKSRRKTIVSLNGTFDIIHNGHIKIISEASKQADVLVVAINSDASVKELKGQNRPINNEFCRARFLLGLEYVDYVVLFSQKTPIEFLEILKPNIHTNGEDYGENCIESTTVIKNGGKIHVVKLIKGISTTQILKGTE